jgi:hypothetical protein
MYPHVVGVGRDGNNDQVLTVTARFWSRPNEIVKSDSAADRWRTTGAWNDQ